MIKYLLMHLDLRPSDDLLIGRMLLMTGPVILNQYRITSGLPSYQTWEDQDAIGRGIIPRPDQVGLQYWTVSSKPVYCPDLTGVEGNFYEILPNVVTLHDGTTRGSFGVHRDANVPGSSGCPVLETAEGWAAFQADMAELAAAGVPWVPLQVSYSY
jgi:hypothetical protein